MRLSEAQCLLLQEAVSNAYTGIGGGAVCPRDTVLADDLVQRGLLYEVCPGRYAVTTAGRKLYSGGEVGSVV